jgi:hypothetical protein
MSGLLEFISELVFQGALAVPVTFVRWLLSGRKVGFRKYLQDADLEADFSIGVIILVVIGLIVLLCFNI